MGACSSVDASCWSIRSHATTCERATMGMLATTQSAATCARRRPCKVERAFRGCGCIWRLCSAVVGLTFDMSGDRRHAKHAVGRPLDGGVRSHCVSTRVRAAASAYGNCIQCIQLCAHRVKSSRGLTWGLPRNCTHSLALVGCALHQRTVLRFLLAKRCRPCSSQRMFARTLPRAVPTYGEPAQTLRFPQRGRQRATEGLAFGSWTKGSASVRPNVRHERRLEACEARRKPSARWRG
jgi:hypothetical protein